MTSVHLSIAPEIEGQGHRSRSRSWARLMRSVRPRSRAVFSSCVGWVVERPGLCIEVYTKAGSVSSLCSGRSPHTYAYAVMNHTRGSTRTIDRGSFPIFARFLCTFYHLPRNITHWQTGTSCVGRKIFRWIRQWACVNWYNVDKMLPPHLLNDVIAI